MTTKHAPATPLPFKVGARVKTWFDTGGGKGHGPQILYGEVIASGEMCYRVRWESGLVNRLHHGDHRVTLRELGELDA